MRHFTYRILAITSVVLALTLGNPVAAKGGSSNRAASPFGITANLIEPFPSLVGFSLNWGFLEYARALASYGWANSGQARLSTASLGLRLFMPNWNLSPFLTLSLGFVYHDGTGSVFGINTDTNHFYSDLGLEWFHDTGVAMGIAYKLSWTAGISGLPSIYFGYFFSI